MGTRRPAIFCGWMADRPARASTGTTTRTVIRAEEVDAVVAVVAVVARDKMAKAEAEGALDVAARDAKRKTEVKLKVLMLALRTQTVLHLQHPRRLRTEAFLRSEASLWLCL